MGNWISENILLLTTVLGNLGFGFGYFQQRRLNKIKESADKTDALQSLQLAYNVFTKDSLERYNLIKIEVDALKLKLDLVTKELITERNAHEISKKKLEDCKKAK